MTPGSGSIVLTAEPRLWFPLVRKSAVARAQEVEKALAQARAALAGPPSAHGIGRGLLEVPGGGPHQSGGPLEVGFPLSKRSFVRMFRSLAPHVGILLHVQKRGNELGSQTVPESEKCCRFGLPANHPR